MKCKLLERCKFFNTKEMSSRPDIIEALKDVYCRGNPLLCARRRVAVAVGLEKVPDDLKPNHVHLVQDLITTALGE